MILAIGYFAVYVISDVLNQFLKGNNQVLILVKVSISNVVIIVLLNILFLTYLRLGIVGYFMSSIIAYTCTIIYTCIKINLIETLRSNSKDKNIEKNMKKYSIPMIF